MKHPADDTLEAMIEGFQKVLGNVDHLFLTRIESEEDEAVKRRLTQIRHAIAEDLNELFWNPRRTNAEAP